MNPENQGNGPDSTSNIFIKRKRGRPRKDQSQISGRDANVLAVRDQTPARTDQVHVTPGFERTSGSVNHSEEAMVGQMVTGVIEATFDAGFLLSVRIGNSDSSLRGIVLKPGHYMPISTENDVAPHAQMINRIAVPIPTEFQTPVHSSYHRGRGRGRARNDSGMEFSATLSNGSQNEPTPFAYNATLIGPAEPVVPQNEPTPCAYNARLIVPAEPVVPQPADPSKEASQMSQKEKVLETDNSFLTKPVTVKLADEASHEVVTSNHGKLPFKKKPTESAKFSDETHITHKPIQELGATLPVNNMQAMWSDPINQTPDPVNQTASVHHNYRDGRGGKMTELLLAVQENLIDKHPAASQLLDFNQHHK